MGARKKLYHENPEDFIEAVSKDVDSDDPYEAAIAELDLIKAQVDEWVQRSVDRGLQPSQILDAMSLVALTESLSVTEWFSKDRSTHYGILVALAQRTGRDFDRILKGVEDGQFGFEYDRKGRDDRR